MTRRSARPAGVTAVKRTRRRPEPSAPHDGPLRPPTWHHLGHSDEATMDDGPTYGFVLRYALRDEVCDWVERQANPADYGISCAFQQRQVETLTQGWLQVDTIETPSLLVWCDDAD